MVSTSHSEDYVVQVDEVEHTPSENVKNRKVTFAFEFVEDPNASPVALTESFVSTQMPPEVYM